MPAVAGRPSSELVTRLEQRLELALRRARAQGAPVLASVAGPSASALDPSALVAAARRPGEPWFCLEQPGRDGAAIAALGCARELTATGSHEERFTSLDREWRELAAAAFADPGGGPPGSGMVAVGGFAFAPDGCQAEQWLGFGTASLVVPELSFGRAGGEA